MRKKNGETQRAQPGAMRAGTRPHTRIHFSRTKANDKKKNGEHRDLFSLCNTYFPSHRTNVYVYARACVCVAAGFCVVVTPSTSPLSHIVWTPSPLPSSAPFASAPYATLHSLCMRASPSTHAVLVALGLLFTRSLFFSVCVGWATSCL